MYQFLDSLLLCFKKCRYLKDGYLRKSGDYRYTCCKVQRKSNTYITTLKKLEKCRFEAAKYGPEDVKILLDCDAAVIALPTPIGIILLFPALFNLCQFVLTHMSLGEYAKQAFFLL